MVVFLFVFLSLIRTFASGSDIPLDETYEWANKESPEKVRSLQIQLLKETMRSDAKPCENFHEFACGNYTRETPVPYRIKKINEKLMERVLLSGSYKPENAAEEKAMQYFNVCVTDIPRNKSLVEVMAHLDRILSEHLSEDRFDWVGVEAQLLLLNLSMFLDVRVMDNLIRVEVGSGSRKPEWAKDWDISNYTDQTINKLYFLNLSSEGVEEISRSQVDFKTKVREFAATLSDSIPRERASFNVSIDNVNEALPFIDLKRYFSRVLGENFDFSREIEIVSPMGLELAAKCFNLSNPKQMFDFYRWHIADKLIVLLEGFPANESEIGAYCFHSTHAVFEPAILSIFKKLFLHPGSEVEIQDMFNRVKAELRNLVEESFGIDRSVVREEALKKVDAIRLETMFSPFILEEEKLANVYKGYDVNGSNHVMNYINGFAPVFQQRIKLSEKPLSDVEVIWQGYQPIHASAFFQSKYKGIVFIPISTVKEPYFHPYYHRFYNYGILADIIGHEFGHGFDETGITFDSEGRERDWLDGTFNDSFAKSKICYTEQYNNYTYRNTSVDGEASFNENVPDHLGLILSFRAYKTWLSDHNETSAFEQEVLGARDLELTPLQAFFVSLAYLHCDNGTTNEDFKEHAPDQVRLLGTLSNSYEFSETYQCLADSGMNPERKCKYL